jgi:hypothetical protein
VESDEQAVTVEKSRSHQQCWRVERPGYTSENRDEFGRRHWLANYTFLTLTFLARSTNVYKDLRQRIQRRISNAAAQSKDSTICVKQPGEMAIGMGKLFHGGARAAGMKYAAPSTNGRGHILDLLPMPVLNVCERQKEEAQCTPETNSKTTNSRSGDRYWFVLSCPSASAIFIPSYSN